MPGAVDQFRYISYPQEIIFAPGSLTRLSEAVERHGWQRLMLCTNRSMQSGGHVNTVEVILGERLVAAFDQVQPHVQDVQVDEALRLASVSEVQAIIGMGGGSPVGMAKAIAYKLAEVRAGDQARAATAREQPRPPGHRHSQHLRRIRNDARFRDHPRPARRPPRKVTVNDPQVTPKLVIYDPLLTLDLPPELTASSGINALAHCIEALYSTTRNPLSTAAALRGVGHISKCPVPLLHERARFRSARGNAARRTPGRVFAGQR